MSQIDLATHENITNAQNNRHGKYFRITGNELLSIFILIRS